MERQLFIYGPVQGCLQVRGDGNTAFSPTDWGDGTTIAGKLRSSCGSCTECNGPKWISGDGTLMVEQRSPVPARVCKLKGKRFTA